MGNRQQRQETWEANERGGDYRMKYRSWRQGEPEGGPFNAPSANSSERTRAVSNAPQPTFSTADVSPRLLNSSQLEGWIPRAPVNAAVLRSQSATSMPPPSSSSRPGSQTPTRRAMNGETAMVFPPEVGSGDSKKRNAPSVSEMLVDELTKAVTDELVGPEFTPVSKPPLPDATEEPPKIGTSSTSNNGVNGEELRMVVNHLYGPVFSKVKDHLKGLPDWYTLKTPPQEVARHLRILLEARRCGPNEVAVSVFPQHDESHRLAPDQFIVVVCAKDRRQLLDAITRCVSQHASISEATIVTTSDGFALDRFVLSIRSDHPDKSALDEFGLFTQILKQDIEDVLAATPASPMQSPMKTPILSSSSSGSKLPKRKTSGNGVNVPPAVPEGAPYAGRFEVSFQEIRLFKVLGEGRTGKTYLADWNGERVAAKVMSIDDDAQDNDQIVGGKQKTRSNLDEFRRELHLVSKLSHPNIVQFLGASARPPRYVLLFELCEGGDVGGLIRQKERKFSFFQTALDIANGLAFLHRNDIIHRDVKPENLMLDRNGRVKVADFGLSCYASSAVAEFTAETGTYRYMAPEVMRHEHYSFPADVYSFALVCYVLLTRRLPFDDYTPLQAAMAVARQDTRPKLPSSIPKQLGDIVGQCWNKDPAKRPDFETILESLEDCRLQLNNRLRKSFDWGFHAPRRVSSSPFAAVTSLAATAI